MRAMFRKIQTRRKFLQLAAFMGLFAASSGALAGVLKRAPVPPRTYKSLPAFLDTLIPADESPSASQLGIDRLITRQIAGTRHERILALGCGWLDHQARRRGASDFTNLGQTDRDAIVETASMLARGSQPRRFFEFVRAATFKHYYTDARSWESLGYGGPPQPSGFPDYALPPSENH